MYLFGFYCKVWLILCKMGSRAGVRKRGEVSIGELLTRVIVTLQCKTEVVGAGRKRTEFDPARPLRKCCIGPERWSSPPNGSWAVLPRSWDRGLGAAQIKEQMHLKPSPGTLPLLKRGPLCHQCNCFNTVSTQADLCLAGWNLYISQAGLNHEATEELISHLYQELTTVC